MIHSPFRIQKNRANACRPQPRLVPRRVAPDARAQPRLHQPPLHGGGPGRARARRERDAQTRPARARAPALRVRVPQGGRHRGVRGAQGRVGAAPSHVHSDLRYGHGRARKAHGRPEHVHLLRLQQPARRRARDGRLLPRAVRPVQADLRPEARRAAQGGPLLQGDGHQRADPARDAVPPDLRPRARDRLLPGPPLRGGDRGLHAPLPLRHPALLDRAGVAGRRGLCGRQRQEQVPPDPEGLQGLAPRRPAHPRHQGDARPRPGGVPQRARPGGRPAPRPAHPRPRADLGRPAGLRPDRPRVLRHGRLQVQRHRHGRQPQVPGPPVPDLPGRLRLLQRHGGRLRALPDPAPARPGRPQPGRPAAPHLEPGLHDAEARPGLLHGRLRRPLRAPPPAQASPWESNPIGPRRAGRKWGGEARPPGGSPCRRRPGPAGLAHFRPRGARGQEGGGVQEPGWLPQHPPDPARTHPRQSEDHAPGEVPVRRGPSDGDGEGARREWALCRLYQGRRVCDVRHRRPWAQDPQHHG